MNYESSSGRSGHEYVVASAIPLASALTAADLAKRKWESDQYEMRTHVLASGNGEVSNRYLT